MRLSDLAAAVAASGTAAAAGAVPDGGMATAGARQQLQSQLQLQL
jgi:hypothetical protein